MFLCDFNVTDNVNALLIHGLSLMLKVNQRINSPDGSLAGSSTLMGTFFVTCMIRLA